MREGQASRTAEYMALFRAVETCRPSGERLFSDPYAKSFLRGGLRAAAAFGRLPGTQRLIARLIDRRAPGPRVSALVRTRLIDDALRDALAIGIGQVVILGAGFDSRPYRIEGMEGTRVFEVDHPDTQAAKLRGLRRRLQRTPPEHVRFVQIDFASEDLAAALASAGYDRAAVTFAIWEGVSNYLDEAAVDAILRWFAANSPPGSRLSFTYVDRGLLDGSEAFPGSEPWLESVRAAGEPFTFGLDPAGLERFLAQRGLRLLEDASTAEALARFPRRGEQPPPGFYHVALAEVARAG